MKFLREWVLPIVVGLLIALVIKTYLFQIVRVDGTSMWPNLQNSERVMVMKQSKVKRMSVVVFDANGVDPSKSQKEYYVKRVVALPGDTVSYKNGNLYVNKKVVPQNFISKYERTSGTGNWSLSSLSDIEAKNWSVNWPKHPTKVPDGCYFVLGDHRSVSNDSRYWGFVPKSKIMGVVKVPFWAKNKKAKKNVNDLAFNNRSRLSGFFNSTKIA